MPQKRLKNPSPGVSRCFALDQAIVMAHHWQVPGPEFLKLVQERLQMLEDKRRANVEHKEK